MGILPICRDAVGVFYSPSQPCYFNSGKRKTFKIGLTVKQTTIGNFGEMLDLVKYRLENYLKLLSLKMIFVFFLVKVGLDFRHLFSKPLNNDSLSSSLMQNVPLTPAKCFHQNMVLFNL